jgi:hypothetical protein
MAPQQMDPITIDAEPFVQAGFHCLKGRCPNCGVVMGCQPPDDKEKPAFLVCRCGKLLHFKPKG